MLKKLLNLIFGSETLPDYKIGDKFDSFGFAQEDDFDDYQVHSRTLDGVYIQLWIRDGHIEGAQFASENYGGSAGMDAVLKAYPEMKVELNYPHFIFAKSKDGEIVSMCSTLTGFVNIDKAELKRLKKQKDDSENEDE